MANLFLSAREVAGICEQITTHMDHLIRASNQLDNTMFTTRPDESTASKNVMNALGRGVRVFAAAKKSINPLSRSRRGLDEADWAELLTFWNATSRDISDEIRNIITQMVDFMYQELENLWKYQGLFDFFTVFGLRQIYSFYTEQYYKGIILRNASATLRNFTTSSFLFLQRLPQFLSPGRFFWNCDAIYYFVTRFFGSIILEGDTPENEILYGYALNIIELGPVYPLSKLESPGAFDYIKSIQQNERYLLERDGGSDIYYLAFAIKEESFSDYSQFLASVLDGGDSTSFYNDYYTLMLFDHVCSHIISTIKILYFKIRRIIYTFLLQAFPVHRLPSMVPQALTEGLAIYLHDCLDILKICKKVISLLREEKVEKENAIKLIYHDAFLAYKELINEGPALCKRDLVKFLRNHYIRTRAELLNETARFLLQFSGICAGKGINPAAQTDVYTSVSTHLKVFQNLCHELDVAVTEFEDNKVVFLQCTMVVCDFLHNLYLEDHRKINSKLPTGQRIDPNSILRQIPLNDELQSFIERMKNHNIFDGTEPLLPPIEHSVEDRLLEKVVQDIDSVPIPEFDTIAQEALASWFYTERE